MKVPKIKVSYKVIRPVGYVPVIINNATDLADVVRGLFNSETFHWTEEMLLICLNRRHEVMHYCTVSAGGLTSTTFDIRKMLLIAIQTQSTSIILSHNHPSGNIKPSHSDVKLTEQVKSAASYFDIKLLDHLIFTHDSFYSFAKEGDL